ncbi:glycosyltransferase family 9 protein [Campylobacter ureolyticus]|uniref:glycosyltransferase family 9 protein n=1 Tax=Campylobacter ureolyticus TaxID=827 RepID=UPI0022B41091|nr:glycosyltransferase family 9 protein [Campylobacter ureolyticus]MCZ6110706.1 glycosyltransferase family 9 protein [Campylobacter ureolyticus]MDK8322969.1 glycosyltransferase family 9 protein [Campylobacter ureolyticus]
MSLYEILVNFLIKNKKTIKTDLVKDDFKTVCFFSNTAIGDTLFNTPVFRAFKENFPNVKTIALLNQNNFDLFKDDKNLDEIITYNGKWKYFFKTAKILKSKKIDIVFILHSNEPQATPLAVLSGAKYIFKLHNDKNEFNKFHSNLPKKLEVKDYVVKYRLKYLEFVGIENQNTRMQLFLDKKDYESVDEILKKDDKTKYIGFQMGASTVSRQWFLERWVELAKLILQNDNYKIILTGSNKDKILTNAFMEKIKDKNRVLNLAGIFNIRQAAALIDRLDILVTPDTGPLHIAAALKTPTIALFAVADPKASNPDFDKEIHKFVKKDRTCNPCLGKRCKYQKCMLQISAKEIYVVLKDLV